MCQINFIICVSKEEITDSPIRRSRVKKLESKKFLQIVRVKKDTFKETGPMIIWEWLI